MLDRTKSNYNDYKMKTLRKYILEYVLRHSGLPSFNVNHPKTFSVSIEWSNDEEKTTNITLNLVQSDSVARHIPLFTNDKDGRPVQTSLIKLKVCRILNTMTNNLSLSYDKSFC